MREVCQRGCRSPYRESREFTEDELQHSLTEKLTGSKLEDYDSFSGCVLAQALEGEGTRELLMSE